MKVVVVFLNLRSFIMKSRSTWLVGLLLPLIIAHSAFALDSKVAGAMSHTVFVDQGSVFAMGENTFSEIVPNAAGTISAANWSSTYLIPTFTGVNNAKSVAASVDRSAALLNNGTVVVWGRTTTNKAGPTYTYAATPVSDMALTATEMYIVSNGVLFKWILNGAATQITTPELGNITSVAAGAGHVLVLFEDGTIGTLGTNANGQLGNGSTTAQTTVTKIAGVTGVKSIAVGDNASFALKTDGTVLAWGQNDQYQLGFNTITDVLTPTVVPAITGVTKVVADSFCTLLLLTDGTVKGSGWHNFIGGAVYNTNKTFTTLYGLAGVKDIFAGGAQTFVDLGLTGVVRGWGGNSSGMLGDGTIIERHNLTSAYFTPIAAPTPAPAITNNSVIPFVSAPTPVVPAPTPAPAPVVTAPVVTAPAPVISAPVVPVAPTFTAAVVTAVTSATNTVVAAVTPVVTTVVNAVVSTVTTVVNTVVAAVTPAPVVVVPAPVPAPVVVVPVPVVPAPVVVVPAPVVKPVVPAPVITKFGSMNDCLKNSRNSAQQCQKLLTPEERGNGEIANSKAKDKEDDKKVVIASKEAAKNASSKDDDHKNELSSGKGEKDDDHKEGNDKH